ncbi:uncharacterized protein si:dkey-11f4.14 isoform X1 [Onychostoma macrolepis]|uniref:uncharacterized protein si:dkey-11f4.14 isoform X1 n=1 Tax=Onychostoma macrolepis TaxID=369639 RepID=UPI00272A0D58|nr:uncharacterized protein si:dkey-11f4.14 isoform X1 [Onychostoma macrolepis]
MKTLGEVFNLFVCVILSRFNAVTSIIHVENGKSVTLNPNIQGNPEDILWTFNGNKVAEHDLKEFQDYGQFIGRSEIQIITGQLIVLRMTSQDSGIYKSVIQIDGKLQNSENEVQVIDAVQQPNVTCILNNITESKTLFCSVSSQFQTTFEWTGSNSIQHSGQELHISKEEKPDSVFTCTVKNEVSQKSTSFALKDCLTDENIILPVILAIIGAIALIVVITVVFYFICRRQNKAKDSTQQNLINMCGFSGTEAQGEDVNQALRNNHDSEYNAEQDTNEDGDESENNEETMGDYKYADVNQTLKNKHVAENYKEQDIHEEGAESEKN